MQWKWKINRYAFFSLQLPYVSALGVFLILQNFQVWRISLNTASFNCLILISFCIPLVNSCRLFIPISMFIPHYSGVHGKWKISRGKWFWCLREKTWRRKQRIYRLWKGMKLQTLWCVKNVVYAHMKIVLDFEWHLPCVLKCDWTLGSLHAYSFAQQS